MRFGFRAGLAKHIFLTERHIIDILRELMLLLKAKFPLLLALRAVAEENSNQHATRLLVTIEQDLYSGYSLSQALHRHTKRLDYGFLYLLHLGQKYGILVSVLEQAIVEYDEAAVGRTALMKRCLYPLFVLLAAVCVLVLLAELVIPQLMTLLGQQAHDMPLMTQVVFSLALFLRDSVGLILLLCGILPVFLFIARMHTSVQRVFALCINLWPLAARSQQAQDRTKLMRTIALLLDHEVGVMDALGALTMTAKTPRYQKACARMQQDIAQKSSLAEVMRASGIVPDSHARLLIQAEQAGSLAACFKYIAAVYQQKYQWQRARMLLLLEPILVSIVSVLIGCMLIGLYAPIFRIGSFAG